MIVFARAPVPGRVKTRLARAMGDWRAARLHAQLTERAVATALAARVGPVELHATPAAHPFFRRLAARADVAVRAQRGNDLGERMLQAFERALRRHRHVVLMGSDCPALSSSDIRRAARSLRGGCDAVLVPAEDGGYVLIGLRRARRALFEGIAWGGANVFAETLKKAQGARLRLRALPARWDVDRPDDLARLRALRYRAASRQAARR